MNTGQASASQVVAAVNAAKAALKSAGYTGPIATVDTMSEYPLRGLPSHLRAQFDGERSAPLVECF